MRRRGSAISPSRAAAKVASAPACASISPAPTGTPGGRPNAVAASAASPRPSAVPGATISAPMRAKPGPPSASSPTLAKKSCGQRRSRAR